MKDGTLTEARRFLRAHWEEGVRCPACGQLVKKYRRKLNSGMARCLIAMLRAQTLGKVLDGGWVHVGSALIDQRISAAAAEYSKLAGWRLIEPRGDSKDSTPSAGYWRVTPIGQLYARRQIRIPKYVYVFDGRFLGTDGDLQDIVDALGEHFNYRELMEGI